MNHQDITLVVVALIGSVPALAALGLKERRDRKRSEGLHDEVRTNHGKKLGEHIEDIEAKVDNVANLMLLHTAQDDLRFSALNSRLDSAGLPRAGDDR